MNRLLMIFALLLAATSAQAQSYVNDIFQNPGIRYLLYVDATRTYSIQAIAMSSTADPVLHVLDVAQNERELAFNDDSNGTLNAFVTVTLRPGVYVVVVRPRVTGAGGEASLLVNGNVIVQNYPFGGLVAQSPANATTVETVGRPLGTTDTRLYGLDCNGHIVAMNDNGGVGYHGKLGPYGTTLRNAGLCAIYADPRSPLPMRLIFNDMLNPSEDYDRDGLGPQLERALTTCNTRQSFPFCSGVADPGDTDTDGIPDGIEVIGSDDASAPLQMPGWGADPRHKDMFVEVHNLAQPMPSGPWSFAASTLQSTRSIYAEGLASTLANPDGVNGLAVHFNYGGPVANAADASLFNDSGGVRVEPTGFFYRNMRHVFGNRGRYFRLVLASNGSGGQTWYQKAVVGSVPSTGRTLAHEMGHMLGLEHWWVGQRVPTNCTPQYQSIMNYLYDGHLRFSQRNEPFASNPAHLDERVPFSLDLAQLELLRLKTSLDFDWFGRVDWNRNGMIDDVTVAAPVLVQNGQCEVLAAHVQRLMRKPMADATPATPKVVRIGNRLFTFSLENERLTWRSAALSAQHGCPAGNERGNGCGLSFDQGGQAVLPEASRLESFDVLVQGGTVWLATRDSGLVVNLYRTPEAGFNPTRFAGPTRLSTAAVGAPELAVLSRDDGNRRVPAVAIFFTKLTGRQWFEASHFFVLQNATGFDAPREALFETTGAAGASPRLASTLSPAVVGFGDPASWTYEACGFFPDTAGNLAYACYDATRRVFIDHSATALGRVMGTTAKPEAALQYSRRAGAGGVLTPVADQAMIVLTLTGTDIPKLRQSNFFGATDSPTRMADAHIDDRGHVHNQWTYVVRETGVAMYDDPTMATMCGTSLVPVWTNPTNNREEGSPAGPDRALWVMPRFDGLASVDLSTGNDFGVMRTSVCSSLRGNPACGVY